MAQATAHVAPLQAGHASAALLTTREAGGGGGDGGLWLGLQRAHGAGAAEGGGTYPRLCLGGHCVTTSALLQPNR